MKRTPSPHDAAHDEEVIKILKDLGNLEAEYPSDLLAARRANFIAQARQSKEQVKDSLPSRAQFIQRLESLKSVKTEYPADLLAARRSAFLAQVEEKAAAREEQYSEDEEIIKVLGRLRAVETAYPPKLLAARRAAFKRQIALGGRVSLLDALRYSIRDLLRYKVRMPAMPTMNSMRSSLVIAILMIAAFVGSLLKSREPLYNPAPTQEQIAQPGPVLATGTTEVKPTICKPGYVPPLCLAKGFDKSRDLTYQGNGSARPAVAKDTLPGYSGVHKASYVNDGLYGPGASWVSNSAYSWIKIDLGKATTINTVTFGRDRLGSFNDRDPGQFVIAVALEDNIYADGNSTSDYVEYTQVYDSKELGFSGIVSGPETVRAHFGPIMARYVKIIFANAGAAVDEVEVFMAQPAILAENPTRKPKDDQRDVPATPLPDISLPVNTAIPVSTDTLVPPDTATLRPTNTPTDAPTNTPIPEPSDTPQPTDTPVPPTEPPPPSDTPEPPPTATEEPIVPATDTPMPAEGP